MQYIEMVTHYNEYHNTQTRKKFYIINREKLSDNYELCHTEYNAKYSDDYDFYHSKECDGGLNCVAVRKPYYRIVTTNSIIDTDSQDIFKAYKSENTSKFNEVEPNELKTGDFIEIEEYEPPQEIINIITY